MLAINFPNNVAPLLRQFEQLPPTILRAVAGAIDEQNEYTVGHIVATKLSRRGPQTLGVITNRLRSSVRPSKATIEGEVITSAIGSNVVYAGPHEFGFKGTVQVRAHSRTIIRTGKGGYAANLISFDWATGRIVRGKKVKIVSSTTQQVKAHSRKMNIPARAPIRRGIQERAAAYAEPIAAAIVRAFDELPPVSTPPTPQPPAS